MSRLKIVALLLSGLGILLCGAERAVALELLVPSVDGSTSSNGRVTRYNGDTGEFLDLLFGPIVDRIDALALGPDGLLYLSTVLSSQDTGKVLRINPKTGQFIDTFIASIDVPLEMTFGPDGNLYVVKSGFNVFQVRRFDGATGDFIDVFASGGLSAPQDLAFGPDGNLYVSNGTGGSISRFDGSTGAAIGGFSTVGLNGPHGLTFGPDGNLYVVGAFSENVVRYNALTGAVIDEFVSQGLEVPTDLTFGPDGNLYINSRFPGVPSEIGGILRYDGQTGNFIDQFVTPGSGGLGLPKRGFLFFSAPEPSITDTCDVGGGPNDIDTVTASYDDGSDEIVVEMVLCADADNKTSYRVYFDHEGGIDDGPDTLDPNPDCVSTWDDRMTHKGRRDRGPGIIDVVGSTLTFRVGVDELDPFLVSGDAVLIWTDTKLKKVTDRAPNTEFGDGCAKPEVASEVLSLELN